MCMGNPIMSVESRAPSNPSAVGCARVAGPRFGGRQPVTRTVQARGVAPIFGAPRTRGMHLASLVLQDAARPFRRPVDEETAA
jgi:hypothetical protein